MPHSCSYHRWCRYLSNTALKNVGPSMHTHTFKLGSRSGAHDDVGPGAKIGKTYFGFSHVQGNACQLLYRVWLSIELYYVRHQFDYILKRSAPSRFYKDIAHLRTLSFDALLGNVE